MTNRFLKQSLQRVSTYLNVEASAQVPSSIITQSSCFIVPTSTHVNTSIQYHFVMPAHMVNPFFFQHFITQNEPQRRYFELLKNNPDIDLKRDLCASVHILGEEWLDCDSGNIASVGRISVWENEIENLRKDFTMNFGDEPERIGKSISKTLQLSDAQLPIYNFELDLENAFFHTELNLAVVHAKSDPSPLILTPDRLVTHWCDKELNEDEVVHYGGWQIEDIGTFSPEHIAPRIWKGRLKQSNGTRFISEPFPPTKKGKFHVGMIGGPIFSDRGCIGMIEGVVSNKQTASEQLGFETPKIQGVVHITKELLEKFILEVVEPQMESRYSNQYQNNIFGSGSQTEMQMEMERDWRNEL